jgi:hypothetical protein
MKIQFLQNLFKPSGATEKPESVDPSPKVIKTGVAEIRDSFKTQSSRDDTVLIAFESGDARSPYVVGNLWNDKDKPPETDETNQRKSTEPQKKDS